MATRHVPPIRTPMIIAHRGASGYRPEHTPEAFKLALELGADALEPDVVPTRDGVLVVRHENNIAGTTDVAAHPEFADRMTKKHIEGVAHTGWFTEDFTWKELKTLRATERLQRLRRGNRAYDGSLKLMRLRDVLRLITKFQPFAARPISVVIEVKHATYFERLGFDLVELLRRELAAANWEHRGDRTIYEAFELGILDRIHAAGMPGKRVFLIEDSGAPADAGRGGTPKRSFKWFTKNPGLEFLSGRVDAISVRKNYLLPGGHTWLGRPKTTDLVARARERDLEVFCWTLRAENAFLARGFRSRGSLASWGKWDREFAAIFAAGVAGVFADQPDLALSVRNAGRGRRRY